MPLNALVRTTNSYDRLSHASTNVPLIYQADWLAQLNASGRSDRIVHFQSDTNELSRSRLYSLPSSDDDRTLSYNLSLSEAVGGGGVLLCRAQNSKGLQKEPCAIVLAGKCANLMQTN